MTDRQTDGRTGKNNMSPDLSGVDIMTSWGPSRISDVSKTVLKLTVL